MMMRVSTAYPAVRQVLRELSPWRVKDNFACDPHPFVQSLVKGAVQL